MLQTVTAASGRARPPSQDDAPRGSALVDELDDDRLRRGPLRNVGRWIERNRDRRPFIDVLIRLHERDQEAAGPVAGSAVAFRLFLLFVPMLLVVVALAGFAASYISSSDAAATAGVSGAIRSQIQTAFEQPSTTRWTALLAGLLGVFSAGRALAKALVLTSSLSWRVPPRQKATIRITALVLGIMFGLALLASIVNRIRAWAGVGVGGLSLIGVAIVYFVAWIALSLALPRSTNDPGSVLPGSALVGASMALLQAFTQFYLPAKVSHASALYGTIGITVVTLGWFFIIGRLAVFSMTLNAVLYERLGSVTTLVFALPVVRILPKKSPRLARFFGLDADTRAGGAAGGTPVRP